MISPEVRIRRTEIHTASSEVRQLAEGNLLTTQSPIFYLDLTMEPNIRDRWQDSPGMGSKYLSSVLVLSGSSADHKSYTRYKNIEVLMVYKTMVVTRHRNTGI